MLHYTTRCDTAVCHLLIQCFFRCCSNCSGRTVSHYSFNVCKYCSCVLYLETLLVDKDSVKKVIRLGRRITKEDGESPKYNSDVNEQGPSTEGVDNVTLNKAADKPGPIKIIFNNEATKASCCKEQGA